MNRRLPMMAAMAFVTAGCLDGSGSGDVRFAVNGSFTEAATQEEMEALADEAARLGGDLVIMESFPAQFRATGLSQERCEGFRDHADGRDYVAQVGSCAEQVEPGDDADEPTSG